MILGNDAVEITTRKEGGIDMNDTRVTLDAKIKINELKMSCFLCAREICLRNENNRYR